MNTQTFPEKKLLEMPVSHHDRGQESPETDAEQGGYRLALVYVNPRDDGDAAEGEGDVMVKESWLLPIPWQRLLARPAAPAPSHPRPGSREIVAFGNVRVDFQRHEAHRAHKLVKLTSLDFKLLYYFVRNPYRVLPRQELLEQGWGVNCYPTTRTVDNKILELRKKLEAVPRRPVHFITMHGAGYKFMP